MDYGVHIRLLQKVPVSVQYNSGLTIIFHICKNITRIEKNTTEHILSDRSFSTFRIRMIKNETKRK